MTQLFCPNLANTYSNKTVCNYQSFIQNWFTKYLNIRTWTNPIEPMFEISLNLFIPRPQNYPWNHGDNKTVLRDGRKTFLPTAR